MVRYKDEAQFVAMMRSGKRPDGSAIQVMPFESISKMDDVDLPALYAYLKTVPPRAGGQPLRGGAARRRLTGGGPIRFRPGRCPAAGCPCPPARCRCWPQKRHGDVQFLVDDLQRLGHAGLAHRAQAVDEGAADLACPWRPARSALSTSWPERMPPSICTSISSPTASHDGRQRADADDGAPSSWRPPWLETISASAPESHRQLGVLHVLDALEDQLAAPALLDPLHVVPVQRRVELLARPLRQRTHVVDALHMAHDVAEAAALGAQHAQAPARLGRHVERCWRA